YGPGAASRRPRERCRLNQAYPAMWCRVCSIPILGKMVGEPVRFCSVCGFCLVCAETVFGARSACRSNPTRQPARWVRPLEKKGGSVPLQFLGPYLQACGKARQLTGVECFQDTEQWLGPAGHELTHQVLVLCGQGDQDPTAVVGVVAAFQQTHSGQVTDQLADGGHTHLQPFR